VRALVAGRFEVPLPQSGLAGVELQGFTGLCDDLIPYESIFYGGAKYDGGSLELPVVPNLSCNRRQSYRVRPVDLLALTTTRTCAPVSGLVFSANIRPRLLGDIASPATFEFGASAANTVNGVSTIESFAAAENGTCVAAGFTQEPTIGGGGCINTGAPTLCAQPGEIELPVVPYVYAGSSRDQQLFLDYGEPVFGAAWEVGTSPTKTPIAGATVELADPSQGKVVYVERADNRFVVRPGATSTNAEGLFMVYLKGAPTTLTVKAPQHRQQTYTVGSSPDFPSVLLAALPRL
jgi:hypothetical protein